MTLLQRLFAKTAERHARRFGFDADHGQWCFCAPVYFEARLDFLSLQADLRTRVNETETAALLAHLNTHFAADGHRFYAPATGLWLLQTPQQGAWPRQSPERACGGDVACHLPKNAISTASILNEIQMLLFEHKVNSEREARGEMPINGVWIWR
jgi:hypothetical protein